MPDEHEEQKSNGSILLKLLEHSEALHREIDEISQRTTLTNVKVENIAESMDELKTTVNSLNEVVRTGNGQPSLTTKMSLMEANQEVHGKEIERAHTKISEIDKETTKLTVKSGVWGLLAGLVPVIILLALKFFS